MASTASPRAAHPKIVESPAIIAHASTSYACSEDGYYGKYWWRYLVGQWLVFCWFWSWRSFDTQLARQKLGKKNTPPPWRPPSPYGCHGAPPPASLHTTISQHDAQQFYVIKTRGYYCFYYLLDLQRHDMLMTRRVYVCLLLSWAESIARTEKLRVVLPL